MLLDPPDPPDPPAPLDPLKGPGDAVVMLPFIIVEFPIVEFWDITCVVNNKANSSTPR